VTAAQVALAVLVGALIVSSAVLFIFEEASPGWTFGGFGLFGFVVLLGMVVSDRTPRT
jgi:hypothetical protein